MNLKAKLIGMGGILLSLYGIIVDLLGLFVREEVVASFLSYKAINFYLPFLNIGRKVMMEGYSMSNGYANLLGLLFSILFLIGAVLYLLTKGKEVRLLRFGYALVFLTGSYALLGMLLVFATSMSNSIDWLFFAKSVGLIIIGYFVLKYIASERKIWRKYEVKEGEDDNIGFHDASAGLRLLHLLIDFVLIACFSLVILTVLQRQYDIEGSRITLYLVTAAVEVLFYLLFESIFGATPAKYLTETRTVENGDNVLPAGAAFKRSFCRVVPFERVAFLLGARWHDRWSDTSVVKEKPEGYDAKKFLMIFLTPVFVVGGWYFGTIAYFEHQTEKRYDFRRDTQKELLQKNLLKRIDNISVRTMIRLDNYEWYKVTDISGDTLFTVHAPLYGSYSESEGVRAHMGYIRAIYTEDSIIPMLKSKIIASAEKNEPVLKIENSDCRIRDVISISAPALVADDVIANVDYEEGTFSIRFKNLGWPIRVVDIEQRVGDIEWDIKAINNASYSTVVDFCGRFISEGPEYEAFITYEVFGTHAHYLLKIHRYERTTPDVFLEELD